MGIVRTEGLTRKFNGFTAVDSIELDIREGEVFGLLGPNGAGKTTTIKMLTTLLPPTSGKATVDGRDVRARPAQVRQVIGYVPQMLSADATLTGYENLLIFAKLHDVPRREAGMRARQALGDMGLSEFGDRLVRTYSGGMVRRLEIAQSALHRPRVLFLDEPTIGLDPLARRAVWEMVRRLREEHGTTIFLTTHLMDEADALCDRVGIMHRSHLVALGEPARLKEEAGVATLDEVFIHHTGGTIETGGSIREIQRERMTARRLG
ncbi:MAG: ATP-binding cassette domain-containing protein [Methanomassiliicoccales archaeon]|nr:ATP-binding cassette domain-containing protein [Methanomassiliicoccales archaeon]